MRQTYDDQEQYEAAVVDIDPDLDEATGHAAYEAFAEAAEMSASGIEAWNDLSDDDRGIFVQVARAVLRTATYHGSLYGPDESPY